MIRNETLETFGSLREMLDTINTRELNSGYSPNSHETDNSFESWRGTNSWEQTIQFIEAGDTESLRRIQNAPASKSFVAGERKVNRLLANVAGGVPCVPLCLAGAPRCMLNVERRKVQFKQMTIVYNLNANGGYSAEQLYQAGARVMTLLRKLEREGYRTNLYATAITKKGNSNSTKVGWLTQLKKAGSPINELNLSFPVINPAMLRRIDFGWMETTKVKNIRYYKGSYGSAIHDEYTVRNALKCVNLGKYVLLDIKSLLSVNNIDELMELVTRKLK